MQFPFDADQDFQLAGKRENEGIKKPIDTFKGMSYHKSQIAPRPTCRKARMGLSFEQEFQ
jgi:hypothetical protein